MLLCSDAERGQRFDGSAIGGIAARGNALGAGASFDQRSRAVRSARAASAGQVRPSNMGWTGSAQAGEVSWTS